eukprot:Sspe_Gene.110671::Locus_91741_Transcript_1_1_Confidence_1.000_Length_689::g.110671::m.110671
MARRAVGGLVQKVVSGGQTGVDRAALDAGLELGIPVGGWCPKGRRAEDGPIDERYPLKETATSNYMERTEQNIIDSDGTLVLYWEQLMKKGGTALTIRLADKHAKPCLVLDVSESPDAAILQDWVAKHHISTLNVAGPREGPHSPVYAPSFDWLRMVLADPRKRRKGSDD